MESQLTTYRIAGWGDYFENNRTREMTNMRWVPIPNKLDGDGYTEIISEQDGPAIYGAWIACVLVASRCGMRGTLLRSGGIPHDDMSLSRITRIDQKVIRRMLNVTTRIGWMKSEIEQQQELTKTTQEGAEFSQEGAGFPHPTDEGKEGNRRKGIEENGRKGTAFAVSAVTEAWNQSGFSKIIKTSKRDATIKIRLRDKWWNENWRDGLTKIMASNFCNGINERGWKSDFDWFVRPDTLAKIIEGKYDNRNGASPGAIRMAEKRKGENQENINPTVWSPTQEEA